MSAAQVASVVAANITMGETNVLSSQDSGNGGLLLAQRTTLSQTATLQSLSFYVGQAAGRLRLGVYDASGPNGGPGAKVAETNEITPVAGWNTAPVISPVTLAAATYWLAYTPSSSSLSFRNNGTGTFRMYSRTYGVLPATFSTSPSSGTDHWSFYATLSPANADTLPPTGTISINNGAATTNSRSVTLTLSATDTQNAVTQMRFSNSATGFSTAETYAPTKAWTLSTGQGTKTVYVQFADAAGNWSSSFTDTIAFDNIAPAISNVAPSNISSISAVINWTTDEPATSQVEYGKTTSLGSVTAVDSALVTTHSVTLSQLAANTTYYYVVHSRDAAANEGVSSQSSFTTLAGASDTTPPTVPTNLSATAASSTRIDLSWTASTDAVGVQGYKVFRNGSQIATSGTTSYANTNLQPQTSYTYTVAAYDAAGNTSAQSAPASAATRADTTPPSASLAAPADNATISGSVNVTATNVADDVAVAGVTFELDGASISAEVTSPPYTTSLDTRLFDDGAHVLTAVARDTSNNLGTSAAVHVTIDNSTHSSATPTLVQHVSTASNNDSGEKGSPYYIAMPNPAGNGNALIVGVSYPYASSGRTATVTDDKGNPWVAGPMTPSSPATGQFVSRVFYALGVAAGTQKITVTFDAPVHSFQAVASEFYNVATASALDGSSASSTSTAPSVSAPALTTANAGDLVYMYGFDATPSERITRFTAGSGFTLLSADTALGTVAEYAVQANAGPIASPVTVSGGSDRYNTLAIALRSESAGTKPAAGIRIVHVYHVLYTRIGSALQFPSTGNLLVVTTAFARNQSNLNVTSSPSNVWAKPTPAYATDMPQFLYAANANTSPDLQMTPSVTFPLTTIVMYDVTGAATSPYDSAAGVPSTWKTNSNNSDLTDLPVITPSAPGELVFALLNDGTGPTTGLVGSAFVLDTITYGGEVDRDSMDNADGYAHYLGGGTSPVSFRWKMNSSEIPETSLGVAIAFRSAP